MNQNDEDAKEQCLGQRSCPVRESLRPSL